MAVLVAVAGAHWVAAQWFERHRDTFKPVDTMQVPVQVALLKPERIEQQAAGTTPPRATPTAPPQQKRAAQAPHKRALTAVNPEPKRKKPPATPPAAQAAPTAEPAQPDASAAATEAASAVAASAAAGAASSVPSAAGGAGTASGTNNGNGNAAHAAPGVKFSVPPSGDLEYDTFYNGVRNQPGTIHWESDGHTYRLVVSVPLPFVGTYSYESHGHVDAFGLAPDQYIEKRGRRGEDVTVFNRETKQIAFTRTPATLALQDGAQDRFSMIMQLASLVRGAPDAYRSGVTREFYVTDNDSGEIWPIETIGDETVRTQQGFVDARHFMRLPRHEGDRRRIDVWLAPSLGWLPVRFVQTEPNGTQVELLWHGQTGTSDSGSANANPQRPNPADATDMQASPPPAAAPAEQPGVDYNRP